MSAYEIALIIGGVEVDPFDERFDADGAGGAPAEDAAHSIPQVDALRLQLAMIAGNEPPTSRLELRWRNRRGGMSRQFIGVRELERAVSATRNLAQIGDVFVGAAPRVRDGGKARDVERVWCLWADLDSREALERAHEFKPAPSIIIETGSGGGHAYWQLNRPLTGPWAQRANRRLAKALGGDIAATDPARVLRPAHTLNHKHEPPRPVECVRLELDAYVAGDVVGRLPDDRSYKPTPVAELPMGNSRPSGRSLDALARVVREAAEGDRNRLLYWSSCRAGEHVRAGRFDAETATATLRDAALTAGLSEAETDRTIRSGLEAVAA